MRSAFRLFMASIVLTVAAGFAWAQESSEPPPPPVPDAAVPVVELPLPPIPLVVAAPVPDPNAAAVDPALTIDPSVLAVAPAAVGSEDVPIVQAPEPQIVVPTTTTTSRRTAKKTAKQPVEKPVAKPLMEATDSYGPMPAKASVAAASTAPASSNAPPPPPPPAAKSVIVETPVEKTEPRTSMGIGGWILAGIVVAAMASLITLLRRRRT